MAGPGECHREGPPAALASMEGDCRQSAARGSVREAAMQTSAVQVQPEPWCCSGAERRSGRRRRISGQAAGQVAPPQAVQVGVPPRVAPLRSAAVRSASIRNAPRRSAPR